MFGIFNKMKSAVLGVDIQATGVRIVELRKNSQNSYLLQSYSCEPLSKSIFTDCNNFDEKIVANTIKHALHKSGTRIKDVAVAVGGATTITHTITVDASLDGDDLECEVYLQSADLVPYPLENVALDFEKRAETIMGKSQVIVAISKLETIRKYEKLLLQAGVTPKIIDVELYAMERAIRFLNAEESQELVTVIDIKTRTTTFSIFKNSELYYTKEFSVGIETLESALGNTNNQSSKEASRQSVLKTVSIADWVDTSFYSSLIQNIIQLLQFFYVDNDVGEIKKIIVSGVAAEIPSFTNQIEADLAIPCAKANPMATLEIDKKIDKKQLAEDASSLTIACGLALRSFDL